MRRRGLLAAALALALAGVVTFASVSLAGGAGGSQAVTVRMQEFKFLGLPKNLDPGQTTFTFRNIGEFDHNFTIAYVAQGRKFKIADLGPGKTRTRTVDLKPGAYVAVCTIFNGYHASQGMVKHFSVGDIDFATGDWS